MTPVVVAVPLPFALCGGWLALQHFFGSSDDFFEGKFTTKQDPEDLVEFYQAEELLKIIAMHPFFFDLFMNKVDPDPEAVEEETALLSLEETHFRVKNLGMEVSFEIKQEESEIDGETKTTTFMRHERFIDWVPGLSDYGVKVLLWDQTWTYGFRRLPSGTVEVFHRGEKFHGPWPIRLIVFFHQFYVIWACEKWINSDLFGSEVEDIDKQQDAVRCIIFHAAKEMFARFIKARNNATLKEITITPGMDQDSEDEKRDSMRQDPNLRYRYEAGVGMVPCVQI